jgi:hypothetical protein
MPSNLGPVVAVGVMSQPMSPPVIAGALAGVLVGLVIGAAVTRRRPWRCSSCGAAEPCGHAVSLGGTVVNYPEHCPVMGAGIS